MIISRQSRLTNWGIQSETYMSVYRQTSNFELADVIVRGHDDYGSLSKGEKLAFGHYLENLCIANEDALVMAKDITRENDGMIALFNRHISWHLGSRALAMGLNNSQKKEAFQRT